MAANNDNDDSRWRQRQKTKAAECDGTQDWAAVNEEEEGEWATNNNGIRQGREMRK